MLTNLSPYIEGYGITTVASIGIILNLVGLAFLITERKTRMFNLLLSSLLIFDTLFLGFNLIKSVGTHFAIIPAKYLKSYSIIVYSGSRFSHISSIFMTVALSHSRFKAVNKPIQHRSFLELKSDRIKYFLKYIIPILFSSVVLTVPCFWEYDINVNESISNRTAKLMPSKLRQNPYYSIFYVGILSLGFLGVLPVSLLFYYTIKISKSVRRNLLSLQIENLPNAQRKNIKIFNEKHYNNLVVNLVVVVFFICHSLRLGLTIVEFVIQVYSLNNETSMHEIDRNILLWLNLFSSISELLLMLNSSVNTVIYKGVKGVCSRSSMVGTKHYNTNIDFESREKNQSISRQIEKLISNNLTKPNGVEKNERPSEQPNNERQRMHEFSPINLSVNTNRRSNLDAEIMFVVIKCGGEFV